jgi:Tol biopolymer transport system component
VKDFDTRNERELAMPPPKMSFVGMASAWSPDGKTIAIGMSQSETKTNYEMFTVDTLDGSVKPLTNAAWNRVGAAAWLADGSGLILAGQREDSTRQQLWFITYPGGDVRRLISDLNLYGGALTLGRDDDSLLTIQEQTQSNIWVAPADDLAQARQVTNGSIGQMDGWYGLKWMAGGRIVYTAQRDENNTIWTMNPDGADQKQLIPFGGNNIYPSVTADERFVVFQSKRNGSYAVWRANRDGSDVLKLTNDGIAAQPDISPDGHWVVYVTSPENSGALMRITISGADPVKLADGASWPRISPDNKSVVCGYSVDGITKLAVISIEGGSPTYLFDLPRLANLRYGVHWTTDGKGVTYRDWANGIWRQNLTGGAPQRLTGLPREKLYAYDWSPDGKFFAFTRGVETRDVVLIKNFR